MYFDGRIALSYLTVPAAGSLVGLSEGLGLSPNFAESDLSALRTCGPRPPVAQNAEVHTPADMPLMIALGAHDDPPDELVFIITSLPAGRLRDAHNGQAIEPGALPYSLVSGGNRLKYIPPTGFTGSAAFQFQADDGCVPPDGGPSNVATVSISVGSPWRVYSFSLDKDPGWSTEGAWAFGQPTGGGSHDGDPTSGYTGDNVYGYNLDGDYSDEMGSAEYLTSPAIDCTGLADVELRFRRWLGVEAASFDHADVQVSNDGVVWTPAWEHIGGTISDSSWQLIELDISALADDQETLYVRWGMGGTDDMLTYPGWNIDDVEIWAVDHWMRRGDYDADADVDRDDHAWFGQCLGGPDLPPPTNEDVTEEECRAAFDADRDGDVDLDDFGRFQSWFTGWLPPEATADADLVPRAAPVIPENGDPSCPAPLTASPGRIVR
jgi:hypothetical protein